MTLFVVISVCLMVLNSGSHAHVIPRLTFLQDSPGRKVTPFTVPDVYNTTTLLLSKDEQTLYVGARDAILSVMLSPDGNLQLHKKLDWSPSETELQACIMKGQKKLDCPNFVRVLQTLNSTHMFACGTYAFSPSCSYIDSEQFTQSNSPGGKSEEGRGRCPYDPFQRNTAITVGGELYTGTVADYRGTRPVISRHLSEGDRVDLKLDDSVGWLEDPTFISSAFIPNDEKVYFFFTEVGREYDFIEKFTVSRVAQVCTSDVGGQRTLQKRWTTFTKTQLLCQAKGELPYNILHDITIVPPPAGASNDDTLFYGTFSSQWSVNSGQSAVCVFSLRSIKNVFAGNYKSLNKETLKWSSRVREKITNPGECGLHNASDNALRFVKENFLADQSVRPVEKKLTLVSYNKRYSNIVAQRVEGANKSEYTVLYLLTESGFLHKVVLLKSGAHIIEEIQVFKQPQLVTNLVLATSQGVVLVGSSEGVISVPVSNCSYYGSCAECVLARDPFCGWDNKQKVCSQISITKHPIQDVDGGNVAEVCNTSINPRSRAGLTPKHQASDPLPTLLPVSLNEVVHLKCPSSSQLAKRHWKRPSAPLSTSTYMELQDGTLSFLATPLTLGKYLCEAVENGFTQILADYEVIQNVTSDPQPSLTTATTPHVFTTTITTIKTESTTQTRINTTPKTTARPRKMPLPEVITPQAVVPNKLNFTHLPRENPLEKQPLDSRPSYLKELVAVTVLLVIVIIMLLMLVLYNLRKSCHSRTAPHGLTSEGATTQERQALQGGSAKQGKPNSNGEKSPNSSGSGGKSESNGHLPNIPI